MTGSAALVGGRLRRLRRQCLLPLNNVAADAATATGERRRYVLSDGSQLLLDARSRVNLDFTPAYRQVRLLDGAVTVSVAPDARRPFLVQTAEGTVRALGTRYMVRQQAQRTVVVVHEHEVEVETMSGAHGTVRAGTGARFDALRMDTPRAELMAEAAWEAGWIDVRGRPLAEVIAALRPYRSGSLRISMAAGGLPVSGHFPLDDTDAALRSLQESMPIHIRRYTPGTCRSTSRPEPSPSCNVLSSGTVSLYTRHSILPAFYLSRCHPDFPAAATSGTADPDIPGTLHGDRDRNRRPGAPARPSGVIGLTAH